MAYVSFSLKYRPQSFKDIVGQEHVSRTLMNAARTQRLHHAYLFCGPRGTGKTSTARVLAKALNCVNGPTSEPCGVCEFCVAVQQGRAMDVIEIDAASNRGIDEIRELREKVKYSPAEARFKVYILDEVHMLTTEAFNALLKTLEEPPAHSFFVLATTEPHRVPPTILSRCQRFEFRPIPVSQIAEALAEIARTEDIEASADALEAIARAGDGAMRDAESIFDQVIAYTEGAVTLDVVHAVLGVTDADTLAEVADLIAAGNVGGGFSLVDRVVSAGKDVGQLLSDLTIYVRDLLRISLGSEPSIWRLSGEEGAARMRQQAHAIGPDRLLESVHSLAEAQNELRSSTQPTLLLELTITKLCQTPRPAAPRPAPPAPAAPSPGPPRAQAPAPGPVPPPGPGPTLVSQQAPPPPAPQPVAGDLDLAAIQAAWSNLPHELRRMGKMPIVAMIQMGAPTEFANGTLTITYSAQHSFHSERVNTAYREDIERALQSLFGRPMRIQCRLDDGAAPPPPANAAVPGAALPTPQAEAAAPPEPVAPMPEPPVADYAPPAYEAPAPGPYAEPAAVAPIEAVAPLEAEEDASVPPPTLDEALANTLSLFEGSTEIDGDN